MTTRTWRPIPADERAAIVATYVAGRNTVWRIIDAAGVVRKRGPERTRPRKVAPPCQHADCRNQARQRGWCMRHYGQAMAGVIDDPEDEFTGEWVRDGLIVRPGGVRLDLGRRVP